MIVNHTPQTTPKASFTEEELEKLTDRIQNAGTEVVNAKAGAVSSHVTTSDKEPHPPT